MAKSRFIAVLGLVFALSGGVAWAQDTSETPADTDSNSGEHDTSGGPPITPYANQGIASDSEVEAAVGTPSISMEHCELAKLFEDTRVVRVNVSKSDIEQPGVIGALLERAAHYAWENCTRWYSNSMTDINPPNGDFHYDLKQVVIYGPDGSLLFEAKLGGSLGGDGFLSHGKTYEWNEVHDYVGEQQRQQEQAAAASQQQAMQLQQQVQQQAVQTEAGQRFADKFWGWVRLLIAGAVAVWALVNHEMLLGWYYGLKPHPARDLVERRINGGGAIDGPLFAEILRQIPGSRIEQRVRAEQARQLTAMARVAAETRLRELEKMKAKAVQEAAFIRAQAELGDAVAAHELAVAQLDGVREWRKRNV
jgi:hypothetical protein